MHTNGTSLVAAIRSALRLRARSGRDRGRLLPQLDVLERRALLTTYTWSAGGDGTTWDDPNNWRHFSPALNAQEPGVPTAYSDVVFPPQAILPKGSSTTIDFNFSFLNMPLDSLTIDDSYTFTGTSIAIEQSLSLNNAFTSSANGARDRSGAHRHGTGAERDDLYPERQHAPARHDGLSHGISAGPRGRDDQDGRRRAAGRHLGHLVPDHGAATARSGIDRRRIDDARRERPVELGEL